MFVTVKQRKENGALKEKQLRHKPGNERKIGHLSEMFDLSPEMLRFIEKKGFLTPSYNEERTYRTYNRRNLVELYEYVFYRNIGFTTREIELLQTPDALKMYFALLDKHAELLESEHHKKELLAELLREKQRWVKTAALNCETYWFEYKPAAAFVPFIIKENDEDQYAPVAVEWRKNTPFAQMCVLLPEGKTQTEAENWGLYCDQRYVDEFDLPIDESVTFYSERVCLCSVVRCKDEKDPLEECGKLFHYARERHLKLTGQVFLKHIISEKKSDVASYLFEAFLPVLET